MTRCSIIACTALLILCMMTLIDCSAGTKTVAQSKKSPSPTKTKSHKKTPKKSPPPSRTRSGSAIPPFSQGGRWVGSKPDSFDNAWIASHLAMAVYSQANDINVTGGFEGRLISGLTRKFGAVSAEWWNGTLGGQNVAIIQTANSYIFAFRGTASMADVSTDLQSQSGKAACAEAVFGKNSDGSCPVIPGSNLIGFQDMWNKYLLDKVNQIKAKIQSGSGSIYVYMTGHSLGAAMCTYMAAATQNAGVSVTGVYPFESPRTGTPAWVNRYKELGLNSKTWLFINPNDPVPALPRGWWTTWVHVNATNFNPANTNPTLCPFTPAANALPPIKTSAYVTNLAIFLTYYSNTMYGLAMWKVAADWASYHHSMLKIVWTLGITCRPDTRNPLWDYVYPSSLGPAPTEPAVIWEDNLPPAPPPPIGEEQQYY